MDKQQFEAWWPQVANRLTATLTRKGVAPADVADVVQETAIRALSVMPDVASADDLGRWAYTVAWRQCIDSHRRSQRSTLVPLHTVSDNTADGHSSERLVEGKLDLERTLKAIAMLSPADRAALMSALDKPLAAALDRKEAVREAVRLHRARIRLLGAVAKLGAAVTVVARTLRKLLGVEAARTATAVAIAMVVMGALQPEYKQLPNDGAQFDPYTNVLPAEGRRLQPAVAITDQEDEPAAAPASTKKPKAAPSTTTTTEPEDDNFIEPPIIQSEGPVEPGGTGPLPGIGIPHTGVCGQAMAKPCGIA